MWEQVKVLVWCPGGEEVEMIVMGVKVSSVWKCVFSSRLGFSKDVFLFVWILCSYFYHPK